ncbi:MAG TPA: efflux RND transporter periplasmic adaptor subunit, partial [Gudongella oleilytica]|nr:efflux RND transporter periplasmic adaptor subunit [Gudongella oleilytica]
MEFIYLIEFSKLDLTLSVLVIEAFHQNQWGWGVTMKKKVLIPVLILSVVGIALVYFLTTGNIGTKYNTVEAKRGSLEKYVEEVGIIRSKNIRQYYSNGSGKVEAVAIELGDKVSKGQILVKFEDNMDLEIQKVEKQIKALEATYKDILQGTDIQSVNNAKIEISRIRSDL